MDTFLGALRDSGREPKRAGIGWACTCPAHDDRTPSMSINTGEGGRVLVRCFAGCEAGEIVRSLGLTLRDLMPDPPERHAPPEKHAPTDRAARPARRSPAPRVGGLARTVHPTLDDAMGVYRLSLGKPAMRWVYTDAEGEDVCVVARYNTKRGKQYRPFTAHKGGWVLGGVSAGPDGEGRPLYRLPELVRTEPGDRVIVCEGEKAADVASSCGFVATTSMHGAQSPDATDWSPLRDRDVVILPDHDEGGEAYAKRVARLAHEARARRVRIVRLKDHWQDLAEKGDIADALELQQGDTGRVREIVERLAEASHEERPVIRQGASTLVMTRMSDVKPKPIEWLWPGKFALGKLSLLVGDPGVGKSFLTLDLAARVTTGRGWPDAPRTMRTPASVVLLSAEDGLEDTIRPRLDAASADTSKVAALSVLDERHEVGSVERQFDIARDLPLIERGIRELGDCRLVIIDPITAYLGETDSHKNAEVRAVLQGLARLAETHGIAVVAVSHLNKANGNSAIYRTMGSLAFTAAARTVLGVAKDPSDPTRSVVAPVKSNIATDNAALAYRIRSTSAFTTDASVAWEAGSFEMRAEDLFGADSGESGGAIGEAVEWLRATLKDGPKPAGEMKKLAEEDGISHRTLIRAKTQLGVVAKRDGFSTSGRWMWTTRAADVKECQDDRSP